MFLPVFSVHSLVDSRLFQFLIILILFFSSPVPVVSSFPLRSPPKHNLPRSFPSSTPLASELALQTWPYLGLWGRGLERSLGRGGGGGEIIAIAIPHQNSPGEGGVGACSHISSHNRSDIAGGGGWKKEFDVNASAESRLGQRPTVRKTSPKRNRTSHFYKLF